MFWNTDKSDGIFCESKQKRACVFIKYYSPKAYVSRNPRVLDTRQTENLGGIGTLRWRNRECNNSPFVVSYWFFLGVSRHKKSRLWCPNGIRAKKMVARTRIELVTRGFSVLCSTNWATPPLGINTLSVMTALIYTHFVICQAGFWKKVDFFKRRNVFYGGWQLWMMFL